MDRFRRQLRKPGVVRVIHGDLVHVSQHPNRAERAEGHDLGQFVRRLPGARTRIRRVAKRIPRQAAFTRQVAMPGGADAITGAVGQRGHIGGVALKPRAKENGSDPLESGAGYPRLLARYTPGCCARLGFPGNCSPGPYRCHWWRSGPAGSQPSLSSTHICRAMLTCLRLDRQPVCWALRLALASAGRSIAAKMAMMAITTNSSMRVKPRRGGRLVFEKMDFIG